MNNLGRFFRWLSDFMVCLMRKKYKPYTPDEIQELEKEWNEYLERKEIENKDAYMQEVAESNARIDELMLIDEGRRLADQEYRLEYLSNCL